MSHDEPTDGELYNASDDAFMPDDRRWLLTGSAEDGYTLAEQRPHVKQLAGNALAINEHVEVVPAPTREQEHMRSTSMKFSSLTAGLDKRADEKGDLVRGEPFVDENGYVRWFTREQIDEEMKGLGVHSPATGYNVYERSYNVYERPED